MATAKRKPAVEAVVAADPVASPVRVVADTTIADWLKIAGPFLMIGVMYFLSFSVKKGWIDKEDVDKIIALKAENVAQADKIEELKAETPGSALAMSAGGKTVQLTPEQWNAIQKLIQDVLDRLTPKPIPPLPPDPDPAPPRPNPPGPTPAPGDLKIVITDRTGKPVTSATVEPHMLCSVTTNGLKSDVSWHTDGNGSSSVMTLPENLGYAFFLEADSWVSFTVTDRALHKTSIRITANHGPQPPPPVPVPPIPVPPDVEPVPPIPPDPNLDRVLGLVVFADLNERDPPFAVLTASRYWQTVSERHRVAIYTRSTNEAVGKAFLKETGNAKGATLLIRDDAASQPLAVIPMPKTEAEFVAAISKYSTR